MVVESREWSYEDGMACRVLLSNMILMEWLDAIGATLRMHNMPIVLCIWSLANIQETCIA
jgi:hypothetical protein